MFIVGGLYSFAKVIKRTCPPKDYQTNIAAVGKFKEKSIKTSRQVSKIIRNITKKAQLFWNCALIIIKNFCLEDEEEPSEAECKAEESDDKTYLNHILLLYHAC